MQFLCIKKHGFWVSIRHGIRQMRTPWADGPEYVTQCPIKPGGTYTYRFTIENQEGTLWWHAHSKWLRATVYGALVIFPKLGSSYPFPAPKIDVPIILGKSTFLVAPFTLTFHDSSFTVEWWNRRMVGQKYYQCSKTGAFYWSCSKCFGCLHD